MDIASFVFTTTPTNDVTMVNKFPGKLAHSFNKLSSRQPTSTYPNWFCVSQVLDVTGIIIKALGQSLSTPHPNVMACRSTFSSLNCLLGSTTQPKAAFCAYHAKSQEPKRQTFGGSFLVTITRNRDSLIGCLTQSSQDFRFERPLCGHVSKYYIMVYLSTP